jgi:hypothetical protein
MAAANPTRPELTQARLKELLHYDPETGVFTRKFRWGESRDIGSVIGYKTDRGYVEIVLDSTKYRAHRLAWFYVHGVWPSAEIDHRDTDRANNRLTNLREATGFENHQNERRARKNNKSGYLGVCWLSTAAHAAYLAAKVKHHPFQTLVEQSCTP